MRTIWGFFSSSIILLMMMVVYSQFNDIKREDVYSVALLLSVPISMCIGLLLKNVLDILVIDFIQLSKPVFLIPLTIGLGSIMGLIFIPIYEFFKNDSLWSSKEVVLSCFLTGGLYSIVWMSIHYLFTNFKVFFQHIRVRKVEKKKIEVE